MLVYLVMREKGLRTDGYYYESNTSIIAGTKDPDKAAKLLKEATVKEHGDTKPYRGEYNAHGDSKMEFELCGTELMDVFWIEEVHIQ